MKGYQFLWEVDALTAAGVPETLYFCCQPGFSSAGKTWHPVIVDPGTTQTDLFSGDKTTGPSTASYGEVVLRNFKSVDDAEGELDWLKQYEFNGRPCRMYYGLQTATYGTGGFTRAYTAIVNGPPVTVWDRFRFTLHGRQAELDIPISTLKFLGNNVSPNGLEGDANLKDQLKPQLIGRGYNCTLTLCNSELLIYAASLPAGLSADEMGSDLHLYDKGWEIYCAGVVTLAYLQANEPPRGQFYVAVEGYIRLGSRPIGTVTLSGASTGLALTAHPAVLVNKVVTDAGFNAGDSKDMLDANSLTFGADKWERGLFLTSEMLISAVIDRIVSPLGYWYFNNMGIIRTGLMEDPAGKTPVYALSGLTNIKSFTVIKTQDTTEGIPAKAVGITYNINNTPMTDVAWSVPPERQEWLKNPNSKAVKLSTNPVHPLSEELVLDTCITTETTEALGILHDLHTVPREIVMIEVLNNDDGSEFRTAAAVAMGAIVSVDLQGRFGYSGQSTKLIGLKLNWIEEAATMWLWS